MWKNYFKVSYRNLSKRKLYAGINILGLTIAMVSFIIIGLYIYHESTYDKMYSDSDRIIRMGQRFVMAGEEEVTSMTPTAMIPMMIEELEEVETGTVVFDYSIFSSVLVDGGKGNQEENKFAFVDHNFFEIFDLPLLSGTPGKLVSEPNQIVLTQSTAERYYKEYNQALGQLLKVDGQDYMVSGVVADFPSNSHIDFDFLASFSSIRIGRENSWSPANYFSYAKLSPNADREAFKEKLDLLYEKYFGSEMRGYGFEVSALYQPLTSIYLGDDQLKEMKPMASRKNLYIFGTVAILLILIGVINYINLATAEATERNREVGLRKVMGAGRSQLFGQFMAESFLLAFAGMLISLILLFLLKSEFEAFSGVSLNTEILFLPEGILIGVTLLLLIAFLSGTYPALILSGLSPLEAMGKKLMGINNGAWMRRGLVVFQFFISISLLLGTLIVKNQLDFMRTVNLGYENEAVVALNFHYSMRQQLPAFKTEIQRKGNAQSASLGNSMPMFIKAAYSVFPGGDNDKEFMITGFAVDHDMIETIGLNLIAGQDFSDQDIDQNTASESGREMSVIFNEAAIRELGWTPEESIGKKVMYNGVNSQIKGVVENFYFYSLHHQVGPLAIFIQPVEANWVLVKLPKGDPRTNLVGIQDVWTELFPGRPFAYRFLDEEYGKMYATEEKIGQLFGLFSAIAILIACMGLFGLVSYVALRRTKEISIRKVLGARSWDVLGILSSDFFLLYFISAVLSIGFGIWFTDKWMADFAYRTSISPLVYILATGAVALIAMLTIVYRTLKVFAKKPAETLKEE